MHMHPLSGRPGSNMTLQPTCADSKRISDAIPDLKFTPNAPLAPEKY